MNPKNLLSTERELLAHLVGAEQVRVVRGGALEFRRVRGEGGDLGAAGAPRREAGPQVCLEVLELGFQ